MVNFSFFVGERRGFGGCDTHFNPLNAELNPIRHPLALARSQYSEGPATGHLDTSFYWFPCA